MRVIKVYNCIHCKRAKVDFEENSNNEICDDCVNIAKVEFANTKPEEFNKFLSAYIVAQKLLKE